MSGNELHQLSPGRRSSAVYSLWDRFLGHLYSLVKPQWRNSHFRVPRRYAACSMHWIYIFGLVCMRFKRPADEDRDRQYPCRLHRNAFDLSCIDAGMYTGSSSMHRVYLFSLVCMRFKRPTDEDRDREYPIRVHWDTLGLTGIDAGMHVGASGMYVVYVWKLD